MKLVTSLTKKFQVVEDYMEYNEDEDRVEYFMVNKDEDDCEHDYSVSKYSNGTYIIHNINGHEVLNTNDEKVVKTFIKTL